MGSKVLLADDSVTIQKVVGIIFANESYDITIVASGDDAIRKAVEIQPDVMLVDALMPGKNGYEVCREVRQNPALRHVGILLMTGAFEVVDEEKNRQSGADEFIVKPFESQALIDATNRMIALTAERAATSPTPLPEVQTVSPATVAAVPSVDDVWATGFEMESAPQASEAALSPVQPVSPAVADVVPVKATADDDLWGAFDMDMIETAAPPVQTPAPATPVTASAADDFFSFDLEPPPAAVTPATEEFVLEEVVASAPQPLEVPTTTGFEPVGEQEMDFNNVQSVPMHSAERIPVSPEEDFSSITFDEPVPAPVAAVPPPIPPVAESAPVSAAPPLPPVFEEPPTAPSAAPPPPEPSPAVQAAATAIATFDEAQVKELLASLSREVIEKIVWEVVPDLAETLIKEEIRKLKAGIA